jgi:hypothetical protein
VLAIDRAERFESDQKVPRSHPRIIRAGVKRKGGRYSTGVVQLWPPMRDQSQLEQTKNGLSAQLRLPMSTLICFQSVEKSAVPKKPAVCGANHDHRRSRPNELTLKVTAHWSMRPLLN